jgi:hypothetical protein
MFRLLARPISGVSAITGIKQLGREANHSSPNSVEDVNERVCTPTPFICLYGVFKDSFTVLLEC